LQLAILKSTALFFFYFAIVRYLRHENGNLKKNALIKIESQCHADSKHIGFWIKNQEKRF
jgi:hypothetical protein